MKSLLNDVKELDRLINCLREIEGKMKVGQFIGAYRECCRLIGIYEKNKQDIVASAEEKQ